jgi:hypothetical protein
VSACWRGPPRAEARRTRVAGQHTTGAWSGVDRSTRSDSAGQDIPRLPRSWIEHTYTNLIHYGEADKGGHFAAFEQPEILISEIRTGLRSLRS